MTRLLEIHSPRASLGEIDAQETNQLLLPAQTGIPNEVHALHELGDLRFTYTNVPSAELQLSISVQIDITRAVDAWLTATSFAMEQENPLKTESAPVLDVDTMFLQTEPVDVQARGNPDVRNYIDSLYSHAHQVAVLIHGMNTLQQIDDLRAKGFPVSESALELLAASMTTIAPELGLSDAGTGETVYTNAWSAESNGKTVILQNFVLDAPTSDTVIAGRVALDYSKQGRIPFRKMTVDQAYSFLAHTLHTVSTQVLREAGGIASSHDAYASLVMRSPRQFNLLRQQLRIVKHDLANPVGMLDSSLTMMLDYGADSVTQIGPLVENYIVTAAAIMKDAREAVCDQGEAFNGTAFSDAITHGADIFLTKENIHINAQPVARVLHPDGTISDETVDLSQLLVHFSRERLDSVVQNILKNSVKGLNGMKKDPERQHSPKMVNISYRLNASRNRLTVWFDDNGTGVPDDMARSGKFIEGQSEWVEGEGTGIGMWTLAEIAREYNVRLYPTNIMVPDPEAQTTSVESQRGVSHKSSAQFIPIGARIISEFDVKYLAAGEAIYAAA